MGRGHDVLPLAVGTLPVTDTERVGLVRDFEGAELELPTAGPRLLVCWHETGTPETEVPTAVARTLIAALGSFGRLAWMSSTAGEPAVPWTRAGGPVAAIVDRLAGLPRSILRTGAPFGFFDDEYFGWDRRGQIVLVLEDRAGSVERSSVLAAIGTRDADDVRPLWDQGVAAVMLPGVDGGFAGIFTFSEDGLDAIETAVRARSIAEGLTPVRCRSVGDWSLEV